MTMNILANLMAMLTPKATGGKAGPVPPAPSGNASDFAALLDRTAAGAAASAPPSPATAPAPSAPSMTPDPALPVLVNPPSIGQAPAAALSMVPSVPETLVAAETPADVVVDDSGPSSPPVTRIPVARPADAAVETGREADALLPEQVAAPAHDSEKAADGQAPKLRPPITITASEAALSPTPAQDEGGARTTSPPERDGVEDVPVMAPRPDTPAAPAPAVMAETPVSVAAHAPRAERDERAEHADPAPSAQSVAPALPQGVAPVAKQPSPEDALAMPVAVEDGAPVASAGSPVPPAGQWTAPVVRDAPPSASPATPVPQSPAIAIPSAVPSPQADISDKGVPSPATAPVAGPAQGEQASVIANPLKVEPVLPAPATPSAPIVTTPSLSTAVDRAPIAVPQSPPAPAQAGEATALLGMVADQPPETDGAVTLLPVAPSRPRPSVFRALADILPLRRPPMTVPLAEGVPPRAKGEAPAPAPISPPPAPVTLAAPSPAAALVPPTIAMDAAPVPQATVPAADVAADLARQAVDMASGDQHIDSIARDIASIRGGEGQGSFRLSPEHLGAMKVDIRNGAQGTEIRFQVETAQAEAALVQDRGRLQADAQRNALSITDVAVDRVDRIAPGQEGARGESGLAQGNAGNSAWNQGGQGAAQGALAGQSQGQGGNSASGRKSPDGNAVSNHAERRDGAGEEGDAPMRRARYA